MCCKVNQTFSYNLFGTWARLPFTPKSDQFQISPAASPEYYITQYEEFGFLLLTKMKYD